MTYMKEMWEASLKVEKFFKEGQYTDKSGVLWLGVEGDGQEEDRWVRQDTMDSIPSAEMQKKMGYELLGWDETPVVEDPYEYNVERTSLEYGTSHLQFDPWLSREETVEHFDGFVEAEDIHEEEEGFRFATYKMVKRRKAGPVEDV